MYAAWSYLIPHRVLIFLLTSVVLLATLTACGERRTAEQVEGRTLSPRAETPTGIPRISEGPSQEEGEMEVDRIAYIGPDGNIFTIKPDGTDSRRITTTDLRVGPAGHILAQGSQSQVIYAWPTWSPDSTKLAASRITVDGESVGFTLEIVDALTGETSAIYDNDPNTAPIARNAPHYIYWQPDSKHLTFIAATITGLSLFSNIPDGSRNVTRLASEGPLYYSWASDSSSVLIHRGMELLMMHLDRDDIGSPHLLGTTSAGFRTPAFSPDVSKIVYVAEDGGSDALYIAETGSIQGGLLQSDARSILDVGQSSAFLWSPTRDEIAVVDTVGSTRIGYDRLTIVGSDGSSKRTPVNEPLLAFFWSPDGNRIVYVAFDAASNTLTWKYIERSGERTISLVEFVPSTEFLTMITFFEQYAYSNSIWSPDGSKIVFSGIVNPGDQGRNGASPDGMKAHVLDVREGATPREIATSQLAVWSWR